MKKTKLLFTLISIFYFPLSFSQENKKHVQNELIIEFKDEYKPDSKKSIQKQKFEIPRLEELNKKYNVDKIKLTGNKRDGKSYVLKFNKKQDITAIIEFYQKTGLFEFVEPNFIGTGDGVRLTTPNDNHFSRQWQHYNDGTFSLSNSTIDADMDTNDAWDITKGDPNLIVAILDSGTKLDHPEFSGRIWDNNDENQNGSDSDNNGYIDDTLGGWDFVNNDNDPTDDHGHGTNVAGIALATGNNNIGYAGMNWNSKIMVCKILDSENSGKYSDWADAIYYAVNNGAAVINLSAGGTQSSSLLLNAVNYAYNNNVAVVVSSGNDNGAIRYPANYTNAFAIGSTDSDDTRTVPFFWNTNSGSNYGSQLDFVAPGNYIYGLNFSSNTNYGTYWGGTSQAAPQVTGLISLLLSVNRNLTTSQIRTILRNTSEDGVGGTEDTPGWDQYYGHGRINAFKALNSLSPDIQSPSAPNLSSENTTTNSTNLSWSGSSDNVGISSYIVYQGTTNIADIAGTTYNVTGLSENTTYNFRVKAKDAAGNISDYSNTVTITTEQIPTDTQAPSAPNLSAANTTTNSTNLSWNGSTDNVAVTGYIVYQGTTNIADIAGTTYNVTGLSENTTYNFRVKAKDAAGNVSDYSNTVTITTEQTPITCDDNIQNGDETGIDCGGTNCEPCPVDEVILYEGYFESGWDGWSSGGVDCSRYSGSRSYEGIYSIRLRDNSGGNSAMTSQAFNFSSYEKIQLTFQFYANRFSNGHDFWLSYYNGSGWEIIKTWIKGTDFNNNSFYLATVTLDASQYNFANNSRFRIQCDANTNRNKVYIDQVIIKDGDAVTSPLIANKNANLELLRTIELDNENDDTILIYPNPVKGNILHVKPQMDTNITSYQIVNTIGQIISKGIFKNKIDFSSIEKGIYFIRFELEDEIITKRIIKE